MVASEDTPADGYGERAAAIRMARLLVGAHRKTLAADKAYNTKDFVPDIRFAGITPHVEQNTQAHRHCAIDGRTVRHPVYTQSSSQDADRTGAWLDQAGRGLEAAQGARSLKGGSGVSVACGGQQADAPGQFTQPMGGAGMRRELMGDQSRFSPQGRGT